MRTRAQKLSSAGNGKKYMSRKVGAALLLLLFSLSCIFFIAKMRYYDPQAMNSFPLPVSFSGEYRQGEGEWQTLTDNTSFNALDGDLYLRGTLSSISVSVPLYLYLDHIYIEISINGELFYSDYPVEEGPVCDSRWVSLGLPADMQETDLLEIPLKNEDVMGNPRAYTQFLRNIFFMREQGFEQYILRTGYLDVLSFSEMMDYVPDALFILYGPVCQSVGQALMLLSILLLGVALLDILYTALFGQQLLAVSVLSLLFSVSMQYNGSSTNPAMHSALLATNMPVLLEWIIIVLLLWILSLQLTGMRKKIALGLTLAAFAAVWLIVLFHLAADVSLCTRSWFTPMIFFAVVLGGAVLAAEDVIRTKHLHSLALLLLLCAILFEMVNSLTGWLINGALYRSVFVVEFVIFILGTVRWLPRKLHEAEQVARMEKEVQQSRVSIALSQIQPHFLFNSLTAIQYLCVEKPDDAYEAVEQLSVYLRGNLDVLSRETLVPFAKEMEHTKAYLHLEKLRFEEKLNIDYDIKVVDFALPALTVQPLVENAVKHGICKTREGGTVKISTRRNGKFIEVVIEDDGAGFDPEHLPDDGREHIGIKNVRTRLEAMSDAVLIIESDIGAGTKATIRLLEA